MQNKPNPISYVEIPVTNLDRASTFYTKVFGFSFARERIDGYDMALLPFTGGASGASGALAKGDVYVPTLNGAIVYFAVEDIQATLDRALSAGGSILLQRKDIGDNGFVAELRDSEGNRIGLSQKR